MTDSTVIEGQQPEEIEPLTETVDIARQTLLGVTLRQLRLELEDLAHTDVTTLSDLKVLTESDSTTPNDIVETGKDILGKVDTLRGLAQSTTGDEEQFVKQIWMAVMKPDVQRPCENTLSEGDEGSFLQRHVVRERTDATGEDVFSQTVLEPQKILVNV